MLRQTILSHFSPSHKKIRYNNGSIYETQEEESAFCILLFLSEDIP
jgi:hypothetical protein